MRNLIFIVACLFVISCSNDNCTPEGFLNTITEHKSIAVTYDTTYLRNDYAIIDGGSLVFEYNHYAAQCDYALDDEWGEKLIFELPDSVSNFEYTDSMLTTINCHYQQYGAWVRHNCYPVNSGLLKGEKLSNGIWEISAIVTTTTLFSDETPKIIEFTKVFQK